MKPYYEQDGITIYHGDCREVLPSLQPRSIDAVVTDPPFFMPATHYQSRVQWQRSWGDTSVLACFIATVLDESLRLLKPTGHFLTFCNGDSHAVFYPEMYRRFDTLRTLVWDKGHIGLGRIWRHQYELILAARWTDSEFAESGGNRSDIIAAKATPPTDRLHPVEKPSALFEPLIVPTVPLGGVVIDPFAGSGTTLEAARLYGRQAVGIEAEERYCEIAAKRLAQGVLDFGEAA